ncbi:MULTISPECIES: 50S ribosomal protein L21e [Acidiplasma]|jgi:large subunit ribosomal protein L21e|uniref:Large ribosomal subunit protein eL21 n=2 Tax=Acidiplasma TaxID=507753 RepID=A0A0Q0S0R3_9ARCH|nr:MULTISPECIES: 50S ribosomal protein L21e [Acidiplasma]KJE48854.1 50S ribosomal protein L21 [Acidiplasma sp. MBA-1]KPV44805.1 50S ribosomal protein L21 [Acidiplasma aeolicum]KQB33874.1 50S ribosomal protein L21 [Acidiplasma aeolicum]KQB36578.1 50S ribosomal protein L21 [Acidiplasma cupricumulans]WMT54253.1 MAG: 50S ribosomal protein L21e [Acidiplasma sp.]
MSRGSRSGSRNILTKRIKERGMPKVNDLLKTFDVGDRVAIVINPAVHNGMPHHTFEGRTGIVSGMQGSCYVVSLNIGNTTRKIISAPVHLKRLYQ